MTAVRVQVEVSEMHRLSPVLWGEDAELEFLRVRPLYLWRGFWCSRAYSQPFPLELSLGGRMCSGPHGGMNKGLETLGGRKL